MNTNLRSLMIIFSAFSLLGLTGCASFGKTIKGLINGSEPADPLKSQITTPRFSEQENIRVSSEKQYRRMNRQKFEEEADVKEDAGSLWVMEGQGAYLFAQNQMRMVGDLLNVRVEGSPKTQLQTKARVISKLLDRLEAPAARGLASTGAAQQSGAQSGAPAPPGPAAGAPAAAPAPGAEGAAATDAAAGGAPTQAAKNDSPFNVQMVPTRIVEQLKDGSYRVRGMQPFMIGKREYKVIVTGIVRGEDFDDAGIDATKLLDSQFDIVSSRKGATL